MSRIWWKAYTLDDLKVMEPGTIHETLGIELTAITDNSISGRMPVDHRTKQPAGILHGGASVVLAESLGSIASSFIVDPEKFYVVGLDVNANHLRPASSGWVYGTAQPVHVGRKTHVWSISITNEAGKLVCMARLTMAVVEKEHS